MYLLYSLQTSSLQNINKKFASSLFFFILIVKKHQNCGIKPSHSFCYPSRVTFQQSSTLQQPLLIQRQPGRKYVYMHSNTATPIIITVQMYLTQTGLVYRSLCFEIKSALKKITFFLSKSFLILFYRRP